MAKFWLKTNVRIAIVGLENQTKSDKYMPVRVLGYDGASYRGQLTDIDENRKIRGVYPVITLVLYFGRTRWNQPRRLSEVFKVPEELKEYFNDYRINIFEISYLSREQVEMFQSDFKIVADYFVQTRENEEYTPPEKTIRHVHEVLELMSAITKDNRFEEHLINYQGGKETMAEAALDKIEKRGEARGVAIGEARGIVIGVRSVIEGALKNGHSTKSVAEFTGVPLKTVLEIQEGMKEED